MSTNNTIITIQAIINAPVEQVWKCWTSPEDIVNWNYASNDWLTTSAENDLRVGGKFTYRMEAKDGSIGFDFYGIYERVVKNSEIEILLGDGRKVHILFTRDGSKTIVEEIFDAESTNPIELQRNGWQAILDNFKKYVESK